MLEAEFEPTRGTVGGFLPIVGLTAEPGCQLDGPFSAAQLWRGVSAGSRMRLVGSGGVRYLLRLEPVEAVRLRRDFELSATQRRVAEYAAAGAQVVEIAEAVGIAPTTVKTHLRAAYATLGIGSRAELAQALQGQLPS